MRPILTAFALLSPAPPRLQKYPIADVRGRGLMLAAECGTPQPGGGIAATPHTAADLAHAAGGSGLLQLVAGGWLAGCGGGDGGRGRPGPGR